MHCVEFISPLVLKCAILEPLITLCMEDSFIFRLVTIHLKAEECVKLSLYSLWFIEPC